MGDVRRSGELDREDGPPPLTVVREAARAVPRSVIDRPDLVARIDAAVRGALTLVIAPAGWGKTTSVAQWTRRSPDPWAWIDLAPHHRATDIVSLVGGAIEVLGGTVEGGVAPCGVPHEAVDVDDSLDHERDRLAAGCASLPDCCVVLDGLDALDAEPRAFLVSLIEEAPPRVRFVALARTNVLDAAVRDRLALRDDLAVLGPSDLAFDRDEVERAVRTASTRALAPSEVERLYLRTRGWPIAVHFAALALRDDADRGIERFGGNDRRVGAFCRAEILPDLQPTRDALRQIAVPVRICSPLCAELTGRDDAEEVLRAAVGLGLLDLVDMSPDHDTEWYSFNPLVREVLLDELRRSAPDAEHHLLERAAAWHTRQATLADLDRAAQYLIRAEDWPAVADHVSAHARRLHHHGLARTALSWLMAIPEAGRLADPDTVLLEAALCTTVGETVLAEAAVDSLGDRAQLPPAERVAVDTIRSQWVFGHLPPEQAIRASEAVLASLASGETPTLTMGGLVTPESTAALARSAHACGTWLLGRIHEGREALEGTLDAASSPPMTRLHELGLLAYVNAWSGSLRRALQLVSQARHLARVALHDAHPHLVLAELAYAHVLGQRSELAGADAALQRAQVLAAQLGFDVVASMLGIERAWLTVGAGAPQRALSELDAMLARTGPPPLLDARSRALATRCLVISGDLVGAQQRLDRPRGGDFSFELAGAAVEVALAKHDGDAARRLLEQWSASLAHEPLEQSALSHALWSAVCELVHGSPEVAVLMARDLLVDAEPERHVRLFLDAGRGARRLLRAVARVAPSPYVSELIAAELTGSTGVSLSDRERTVLRHLANRLTYSEIAELLYISQNTVKTHAKSVYTKLGASGRRDAVDKATAIGLV